MNQHTFLQQLQALEEKQNTKYVRAIDKKGGLILNRKLPPQLAKQLPMEMIPQHILRLFQQYQEGELQRLKRVNVPRYHDQVKTLRRYFLIDQPQPVARKSPAEMRAYHREHLRAWRRRHRPAVARDDPDAPAM